MKQIKNLIKDIRNLRRPVLCWNDIEFEDDGSTPVLVITIRHRRRMYQSGEVALLARKEVRSYFWKAHNELTEKGYVIPSGSGFTPKAVRFISDQEQRVLLEASKTEVITEYIYTIDGCEAPEHL